MPVLESGIQTDSDIQGPSLATVRLLTVELALAVRLRSVEITLTPIHQTLVVSDDEQQPAAVEVAAVIGNSPLQTRYIDKPSDIVVELGLETDHCSKKNRQSCLMPMFQFLVEGSCH